MRLAASIIIGCIGIGSVGALSCAAASGCGRAEEPAPNRTMPPPKTASPKADLQHSPPSNGRHPVGDTTAGTAANNRADETEDKRQNDSKGNVKPPRCMVPTIDTNESPPPIAAYCPIDPQFGGPQLERAIVSFPDAPNAPQVNVELATNPEARARGLMFRRQMSDDAGMLFDMPNPPQVQSFWMRNTCISLDMLFIEEDGFIAGILRNVPTMNEESRSIPCPVRYVLELNAGWTQKHGVKAGQMVKLPSR